MLIPQIWADTLLTNLKRRSELGFEYYKQETLQHEQRMATDPDYARAYELRQAEDEAESYWIALYENQRLEEDEYEGYDY